VNPTAAAARAVDIVRLAVPDDHPTLMPEGFAA